MLRIIVSTTQYHRHDYHVTRKGINQSFYMVKKASFKRKKKGKVMKSSDQMSYENYKIVRKNMQQKCENQKVIYHRCMVPT